MSVVLECLPGDPIFCICTFNTCPHGMPFSWENSREIKLGEKVTYRGSAEDEHFKDHPNRWQVNYETADGTQFQAVAFLFVTEETWLALEQFFRETHRTEVNGSSSANKPLASTA